MIIDLQKFIASERPYWAELERVLEKLARDPALKMPIEEVQRFHYLYQRASADLSRISTFTMEPEMREYLETLTSRAYGEINEVRNSRKGFSPLQWLLRIFPRTFRKHIKAFVLALAITCAGFAFGGAAVTLDPEAKQIIMPFQHLLENPAERVRKEESTVKDNLKGVKMAGAAWYMTHNTRVSIFTLGLGITYGIGTSIMLFYNGVILGAVSVDYVAAGKAEFLLAWLSPHGALEIPAILIAGQAGLILAGALIGWRSRIGLRARLRKISGDLITLSAGLALMLVWAGIIESFISQYHQPVIPYPVKILFGTVELVVLAFFLARSGASGDKEKAL